MEAQAARSTHPLLIIASIAVILFSAAGVAAIMGWIPSSSGKPEESAAKAAGPQKNLAAPGAPRAAGQQQAAAVVKSCANCGVVQSVREYEKQGEGTGLGAVGGAVAGGVLGHQIGNGRGQDLATVVGAVGGGIAGHEIEKRVRTSKGYQITVRMEDGTIRTFNQSQPPAWRPGDRVRMVDGVPQSMG